MDKSPGVNLVKYILPESTNVRNKLEYLAWSKNNHFILFQQEFELAIQDLETALKCDRYPKENRFKLYQRLAKAKESIKDYPGAVVSYQQLIQSFDDANLTADQVSMLYTLFL
jgi:tetratricopeptide (TPR) repeat protein